MHKIPFDEDFCSPHCAAVEPDPCMCIMKAVSCAPHMLGASPRNPAARRWGRGGSIFRCVSPRRICHRASSGDGRRLQQRSRVTHSPRLWADLVYRRSNHQYPLHIMAGIPTDQLAPIDQAAKYASTDPAKAEDIYREILSKKAGECAKVVVVIGALISSRRGWSAGSGDGSGQAWSALQGSQVSSLRPSLTAGSRIAKRRSSLSLSLTLGHLCRRSPRRRRLSSVSSLEPGDVLEAHVSPHAHRLLPRISTRPADASHE